MGPVEVLAAIDDDKLIGIKILSHEESLDYAEHIEYDYFLDRFKNLPINKYLNLVVLDKENPEDIIQVTGATISSQAVVNAVNAATVSYTHLDVYKRQVEVSYEGINVKYLIDNYVKAKSNAGNIIFKDKSRKTIITADISEAGNYMVAYGINEVPLVYLDTDEGYIKEKHNDNGCFKLVYEQDKNKAEEFSNVAYIYIEEKDAKNIFEHSYAPYNAEKYTDYELIIHGSALGKEVRYKVKDIEAMTDLHETHEYSLSNSEYFWYYNTYKGVPLWDLLLKAGLDPDIDENTSVRFIARCV